MDEKTVNTGGGAYIRGDVKVKGDFVAGDKTETHITGDGNVVGDHSSATVIKQANQGATLEGFLRLLTEIRQALPAAGLDRDMAQVIEGDYQVVEKQAKKEKPSAPIIVAKLKSAAEVLTATGTVLTAGQALAPLAQQAIQWAQQLFH